MMYMYTIYNIYTITIAYKIKKGIKIVSYNEWYQVSKLQIAMDKENLSKT